MVHKIFKDAGYAPNWIELNNSGVRTYIAQMYLSSDESKNPVLYRWGCAFSVGVCTMPCRVDASCWHSELHSRFGLKAMQNARLIRLIEEANLQGAVFDQPQLGMLTNITVKSIRSRLSPLLRKGVRLPLLGQSYKYRRGRCFRITLALEEYFSGKTGADIMADFQFAQPEKVKKSAHPKHR